MKSRLIRFYNLRKSILSSRELELSNLKQYDVIEFGLTELGLEYKSPFREANYKLTIFEGYKLKNDNLELYLSQLNTEVPQYIIPLESKDVSIVKRIDKRKSRLYRLISS